MQVARANASALSAAKGSVDPPTRITTSYAPLYLTTSLGNTSFDLEDLEKIALDRLRVLKAAERARAESQLIQSGGGNNANSVGTVGGSGPLNKTEFIRNSVRKAMKQYGLDVPNGTGSAKARIEREDRIMKDEASHFLIRLALCRTQEQRQWVLSTECDLFGARLEFTGIEFALHALDKVKDGPDVKVVNLAEMERFRVQLDAVARGPCRMKNGVDLQTTRFYKTHFEQVPGLIRSRRVFVHEGMAFVPERNVMDIVSQQFRARLSGGLVTASKAGIIADSDARMRLILESIRQHFTAETTERAFDPSSKRDKVDTIGLSDLNDSLSCMPLCMRHMMHKLRENHHLRHSARMQLGVFLKGCGLTMDESLRFWKTEFGKGDISGEKFEKNYAYNVRHHYGKEGKRKNLNPFPCIKIINERPGPGEHHGCPFREMQEMQLTQTLRAVGVDPNRVKGIVEKAASGNFQLACGLCFSTSQPGEHVISETGLPQYVPSHPNEYFIEARRRRFAPLMQPKQPVIDEDLDDEELIHAAQAAESQTQSQSQSQSQNEPKEMSGSGSKQKDESQESGEKNIGVTERADVESEKQNGEDKDAKEDDVNVAGNSIETSANDNDGDYKLDVCDKTEKDERNFADCTDVAEKGAEQIAVETSETECEGAQMK